MTLRPFYVADLNPRGDVHATETYRYPELEQIPGASELITHFATHIWRSPDGFENALPRGREHLTYRFAPTAKAAAITSLRSRGDVASIALYATGIDPQADQITLETFQRHLLRELHGTEFEVSFALMDLKQRPLVAVMTLLNPTDKLDQLTLALADRCFAAAYFRYHNLA